MYNYYHRKLDIRQTIELKGLSVIFKNHPIGFFTGLNCQGFVLSGQLLVKSQGMTGNLFNPNECIPSNLHVPVHLVI